MVLRRLRRSPLGLSTPIRRPVEAWAGPSTAPWRPSRFHRIAFPRRRAGLLPPRSRPQRQGACGGPGGNRTRVRNASSLLHPANHDRGNSSDQPVPSRPFGRVCGRDVLRAPTTRPWRWEQRTDSNGRPRGYGPRELPGCSTLLLKRRSPARGRAPETILESDKNHPARDITLSTPPSGFGHFALRKSRARRNSLRYMATVKRPPYCSSMRRAFMR